MATLIEITRVHVKTSLPYMHIEHREAALYSYSLLRFIRLNIKSSSVISVLSLYLPTNPRFDSCYHRCSKRQSSRTIHYPTFISCKSYSDRRTRIQLGRNRGFIERGSDALGAVVILRHSKPHLVSTPSTITKICATVFHSDTMNPAEASKNPWT